jgi:hypothetical protein
MAEKLPHLFIALINEVFGTEFPDDARIETHRNEFITKNGKIITDSIFLIERRLFHIECQTNPDQTMAIRMFEYDFAIAIEEALHQGEPYEINLPESCVIYIRANKNTPDTLTVRVRIGDVEVPYTTRVIKAASYTLDELISKKLKVLLPYYMVRYEKALPQDFVSNCQELLVSTKSILTPSEEDLIGLIMQIAERIAPDEDTRKEVSDMGGKVLELWSEKKKAEGLAEGQLNSYLLFVSKGRISLEEAAEELNMPVEAFKEAMIKAGYKLPEKV